MKNLVLTSILLLFFGSCAVSLFSECQCYDRTETGWQEASLWFQNDDSYSLFNATIDIRKNHYTGLMVMNPLPVDGHRVIFMTEFGLKVFDMEFSSAEGFNLYYCMAALNRKPVIKTLRNDIGLITGNERADCPPSALCNEKAGETVYKFKINRNRYYYTVDNETLKISSVLQTSPLFKKVRIEFYGAGGNRPDSVTLEHYNTTLIIKLAHINGIIKTSDE